MWWRYEYQWQCSSLLLVLCYRNPGFSVSLGIKHGFLPLSVSFSLSSSSLSSRVDNCDGSRTLGFALEHVLDWHVFSEDEVTHLHRFLFYSLFLNTYICIYNIHIYTYIYQYIIIAYSITPLLRR